MQLTLDVQTVVGSWEPDGVGLDALRAWQWLRHHAFGREHAQKASTIADAIGVPQQAQDVPVRRVLRELVSAGAPVASCAQGYFVPTSLQELQRCVSSLRRRAAETDRRADSLEQATGLFARPSGN